MRSASRGGVRGIRAALSPAVDRHAEAAQASWRIALPSLLPPSATLTLESVASPESSDVGQVASSSEARRPARSHRQHVAGSADGTVALTASLPSAAQLPWSLLLAALWVAGSIVAILRLVIGLVRVDGIRRRATVVDVAEWRDDMDMCVAQLGLSRDVELLTSDDVQVPMTCGWRRPAVLVPTVALSWSDERRRVVLLHELAHVQRGDFAAHIAASLAAGLHWLNPLA